MPSVERQRHHSSFVLHHSQFDMSQDDKTTIHESVWQQLRAHGMGEKVSKEHHRDLRRASVLMLIANDLQVLFTQRSAKLKSHPGEVCFPGGKQDPEDDNNDLTTALRETHEEVGLDLRAKHGDNDSNKFDWEPLCRMRTIESINHLCVTPIVACVNLSSHEIEQHLTTNTAEVDATFWVPLDHFAKTTPDEQFDIDWSGETFVFRKYLYPYGKDNRVLKITGLTAHIAHEVSSLVFHQDRGDDDNPEDR